MKEKRKMNIWLAITPIVVVIILALFSVLKWKAGMLIPLIGSMTSACLVGLYLGFDWEELLKGLVDGITRAAGALFILFIVGAIVGTWIQGGIIPALIYYALKIINPAVFVPAACFVTAIVASATGTSFTSIATIGLALMATGLGMGFPAPLLAGAIISGAFFGDSVSPLSDSTNLSSAMTGTNLFEVVAHIAKSAVPTLLVAVAVYYFAALPYLGLVSTESQMVNDMLTGISGKFYISPILFIVPGVTVFLSVRKFPALPTLVVVALLGGIFAMLFQGASVQDVVLAMTNGYKADTGFEAVDKLLSRGGISSMANTVMLMSLAAAMGGLLEKLGVFKAILDVIMRPVKGVGSLVTVTVLSGLVVAYATGAQMLAIVIPARMFPEAFRKHDLHPKNLARIATSIGTVCITLVPWSVPSTYASGMFNVSPADFLPYLYYPMLIIVTTLLFGFFNFTMTGLNEKGTAKEAG